jgi:hypothetical protein
MKRYLNPLFVALEARSYWVLKFRLSVALEPGRVGIF